MKRSVGGAAAPSTKNETNFEMKDDNQAEELRDIYERQRAQGIDNRPVSSPLTPEGVQWLNNVANVGLEKSWKNR